MHIWLAHLSITGKVPDIAGGFLLTKKRRIYHPAALNTFDTSDSHGFQQYFSLREQ